MHEIVIEKEFLCQGAGIVPHSAQALGENDPAATPKRSEALAAAQRAHSRRAAKTRRRHEELNQELREFVEEE